MYREVVIYVFIGYILHSSVEHTNENMQFVNVVCAIKHQKWCK